MALLPAVSSDLAKEHEFGTYLTIYTCYPVHFLQGHEIFLVRAGRVAVERGFFYIVHMRTGHRKVAVIRSREVAAKQGFFLVLFPMAMRSGPR